MGAIACAGLAAACRRHCPGDRTVLLAGAAAAALLVGPVLGLTAVTLVQGSMLLAVGDMPFGTHCPVKLAYCEQQQVVSVLSCLFIFFIITDQLLCMDLFDLYFLNQRLLPCYFCTCPRTEFVFPSSI